MVAVCSAVMSSPALARVASPPDLPPPPRFERIDVDGLAPYHASERPMVDEQGRVKVIVDFTTSAVDTYAEAAKPLLERFDPKTMRHNPQALMLIEAIERKYGIAPEFHSTERSEKERTNITTWVGASITAFLPRETIAALRRDKNVRLVTDDQEGGYSWTPSWNGPAWTELNDWGWNAVQGKPVFPGSTRRVWIIDSGVAYHADLGSVSTRQHASSPTGSVVGCYAHATHVAGIIGATSGNGIGRRGVYAGVEMRSINGGGPVAFRNSNNTGAGAPGPFVQTSNCANGPSDADVGIAFDMIYWASVGPYTSKANIVNLSMNSKALGYALDGSVRANQSKAISLVTPASLSWFGFYPGNVLVQSAGNDAKDACTFHVVSPGSPVTLFTSGYTPAAAATAANPNDGVLLVGAVNQAGQEASAFAAAYPPIASNAGGTNFGACVDIWAPGNFIYSTWGQWDDETSDAVNPYGASAAPHNNAGQPASCANGSCNTFATAGPGWAHASGTSFAAPHVAAAAAYYADKLNLSTPAQIEQAVRANANAQILPGRLVVRLQ